MMIIERSSAKAEGLKRYYTGRPCKAGHISERSVANGTCWECMLIGAKGRLRENPNLIRAKARAYWWKNRAHKLEQAKKWQTENPAYCARKTTEWKVANPDKVRASDKRYRLKNKDKIFAANRKWIEENREKKREQFRRYRAQKIVAVGFHTIADIQAMLFSQGGKCAGCKANAVSKLEVDHIVPLSRGGSEWPDNLQLLCRPCNASKGAKTMEEWKDFLEKVA